MVLLMVASALVSLSAQNSEIELERVFSKRFDRPIAMIPVIGYRGEFFVAQQGGEIFHVGRGKASLVMKLGAEVSRNHNEEGLLSMALSPRFISDGRLFLYYSASFPRRSLLSEVKLVRTKAGAWKPLRPMQELLRVKQPYGNHNGGTVLFGPDGFLYLGLGDGGSGGDPKGHGQNLATILGTIIRIDVSKSGSYAIPKSNPFIGRQGSRPEIWAYGLRNPWRMSFDRVRGALWVGDVGQAKYEEVNIIKKGGNYGWNRREGKHNFKAKPSLPHDWVDPVIEYEHREGQSITGGYVYRGKLLHGLEGVYFFADFVQGTIWGLKSGRSGIYQKVVLKRQRRNIASFAEDSEGELYVLCFDGFIYQIVGR